jgi:uncharacterized protein
MNTIDKFLSAKAFAVAGASSNRAKFGNKVFRALLASHPVVYPVNPVAEEIEGHRAYASLADLPSLPESLSIITPAEVTRRVVAEAISLGVKNIWMQPGAEDRSASAAARAAGLNVIDDGSCILVVLAMGH